MANKKYICVMENIDYYDSASQDIKNYFGKEWSSPVFKRKRDLRAYINNLNTLGIASYTYYEQRVK